MILEERHFVKLGIHDTRFDTLSGRETWFFHYPKTFDTLTGVFTIVFQQIQQTSGTSILFITHDVSVVAQLADRVVVMYAGRTVEIGSVYDVFRNPLHPYTKGLLKSIPKQLKPGEKPERLTPIPGTVPNPAALPSGCPFHPRCDWADKRCKKSMPGIDTSDLLAKKIS